MSAGAEIGRWLGEHPRATLAMIGSLGLAVYALSCWWFPFGKCWCCKGSGRHYRKDGRVFRDCKRMCKGTGRRRRVGRTMFEWARRTVKNTI